MNQKILAVSAWAVLGIVATATIVPIGLRPQVASQHIEHLVAFAVIGLLFGLAYPRALGRIVLTVAISALLLELLQLIEPSRHGTLFDFVVKTAGGIFGVLLARTILFLASFRRRS